ncbi:alpha/beta fold hydrolase [Sphingomonas astaxanthinifaciens]|uniref:Alpha/beta hydrolase n=1 Tax=Sphingomonas astaxanthinifaciens DSM 22298 TaxID=1123267 RepID=A0ABQ5ZAT0_9SPHN|nr:alpha/beta hydrolase [Sphingomonas astaxanthinifaciens]GLR48710.1 alpha/beta hydrolase [Sphingomonas astaxanthinifaciens DSM 22298]
MASFEDRSYNSADGLRLHYRDYAGGDPDQPPILCLPGLTRNCRDFEPVADRFAGEWRVLSLDFRGRGQSAADPDPSHYMPATYARDVLKLLDQLGIADAVFVGTSLGGLVTMLIGAMEEERIAGALLNDIGPEVSPQGIERIRNYVGKAADWPSFAAAGAAFAERAGDVYPHWGAAEWERFARRTCREEGGAVVLDYDMAIAQPFAQANEATQPNLWPWLDHLKDKPVTILRGALSDLFDAPVAERMVRELGPNAELVTVPDVGHAPSFDEPESIAAVERLLARVRAAA